MRTPTRSVFARVLVATIAAGVVAVAAATAAAGILVRSSQEASLVDAALVRANAARDGVDRDLALALADLRTAALGTVAGDPLAVTAMLSGRLTALRCLTDGDEVLDAAATPQARVDLRSRPIPEPGEVVLIEGHKLLASVRVGGVTTEGLVDVSDSLRVPSGWSASLVAGAPASARGARPHAGVVVHREVEAGDELVRIVAPQDAGFDVVIRAPLAPARAAANATAWRVVLWSLLALPVLFGLAWLLSRAVAAPIVALARAVREAPTEQLTLPHLPSDEIGELGAAIAAMSSRLRGDAQALAKAAAFARRVSALQDPDEILNALERALREAVPDARWLVLPTSEIVDGKTDGGHTIPVELLAGAAGTAAVDSGEVSDRDTLVQRAVLVDKRRRRVYLAIRSASALYGIVIGEVEVSDTIPVGVAEVLVRSASSALRTVDLFRSALANEKLAALGRLATSVAHEMNNPLAFVLANAVTLEAQLEGERREAASDIREGAERLARIVRDISSLARTDATREATTCDLIDLVGNAVKLVSARGGGSIVVRAEPGVRVRVDAGRIEQALVNLLANAIDATHDVESPRVEVAVRAEGNSATIEVRDNGHGMPRAVQKRLFESFVSTKGNQGTGLGLYLSKQFVHAQGGDLVVASTGASGTTFRVTLPLAAPLDGPRPAMRTVRPPRISVPGRARVLLIDDEELVLRALSRMLVGVADVTTTTDPTAAIELAASGKFSLVITDLNMPEMRGDELIQRLRARMPGDVPRVVIMTGSGHPNLPGVEILTKPFGRKEIDALFERA